MNPIISLQIEMKIKPNLMKREVLISVMLFEIGLRAEHVTCRLHPLRSETANVF